MHKTTTLLLGVVALLLLGALISAQQSDEQSLREAIAKPQMNIADDAVVWSGATDSPLVGKESRSQARAKISAERRNQTSSGAKPERLAVAKSGDLAYDYGHTDFDWEEVPSGAKRHVHAGYLRVWQKIDGQWKAVAFFARPDPSRTQPVTAASDK